jgi:hypothetical protein
VGRKDGKIGVILDECGESSLVVSHHGGVELHDISDLSDEPRGRAEGEKLGALVIGIASVEYPTIGGLDGDASVAGGVSVEGDEKDLRGESFELADSLKAEPRLASGFLIELPLGVMRPKTGGIALFVEECGGICGASVFGGEEVDFGVWEVAESARVVKVEVCGDNMADIFTAKAASFELFKSGYTGLCGEAELEGEKTTEGFFGIAGIFAVESRIDQDKPVVGFDEEDATGDLFGEVRGVATCPRAAASTMEVVDL